MTQAPVRIAASDLPARFSAAKAPEPPWGDYTAYERFRLRGREWVMALGLAASERQGLIARAMPELRLVRHFVRRGAVALDVGANIGVVASEIARWAGVTYAFEINPIPYRILQRLERPNLVPLWAAVGARSGEGEFCVPRTRKGYSSNGGRLQGSAPAGSQDWVIRAPVVALDDIDFESVGFLKIDVEGGELGVLEGARETLRRHRPAIMVEHEVSHAGADFGDVFRWLAGENYDGVFLGPSGMEHLSRFDRAVHQREGASKATGEYVSNFFYVPRG